MDAGAKQCTNVSIFTAASVVVQGCPETTDVRACQTFSNPKPCPTHPGTGLPARIVFADSIDGAALLVAEDGFLGVTSSVLLNSACSTHMFYAVSKWSSVTAATFEWSTEPDVLNPTTFSHLFTDGIATLC